MILIPVILVLVIVGAVVVSRKNPVDPDSGRKGALYAFLFILLVLAATGVAGLLTWLLPGGVELTGDSVASEARSLAFAFVAGPLAAILGWRLWQRIDDAERDNPWYGRYVALMTSVSLIVGLSATGNVLSAAAVGEWRRSSAATALVWALMWAFHRRIWSDPSRSPRRLTPAVEILGSGVGLLVAGGGAVTALGSLFEAAFDRTTSIATSAGWWETPSRALVWTVLGATAWWYHWVARDAMSAATPFAKIHRTVLGAALPAAAVLSATGTLIFTGLRSVFSDDSTTQLLEPVPWAVAVGVVASSIWRYHHIVLPAGDVGLRRVVRLTIAGIGLVTSVSGVGVLVNVLLRTISTPLLGDGPIELLLGGVTALVVGVPQWWAAWRPTTPRDRSEMATMAYRAYLVLGFGLAGLTALISALVIAYEIFEIALEARSGGVLEAIRAPLGVLTATGLAAAYHFPIWRESRRLTTAAKPTPRIGSVVLVTGTNPDPIRSVIVDHTGAEVTVWRRADTHAGTPDLDRLAAALDEVEGKRVMVVTGPGAHLDVIPLT